MPFTIRPYHYFLTLVFPSGAYAVITVLLLSAGPAYAEWKKVDSSAATGGYSAYVDLDTIRRKGEMVRIWYLLNYKTLQSVPPGSYLSQKAQAQFDCAEARMRVLTFTNFSGHMGSGDIVNTNIDEDTWRPLAPRSVGHAIWEMACGKR
jgi:hypothetical protein